MKLLIFGCILFWGAAFAERKLLFGGMIHEICYDEIMAVDMDYNCNCVVFENEENDVGAYCGKYNFYDLLPNGLISEDEQTECENQCPRGIALIDCALSEVINPYICQDGHYRHLRSVPRNARHLIEKRGSKFVLKRPEAF
mmetsp:Transcript_19020/g.24576  ORF Transcript_19020/g.24576 Transcript_19020/m.24576 type:complete len:141 (-) Transcript_19020:149-571(-)